MGAAKICKELKRHGLLDLRPFSVEVNSPEDVTFEKTARRECWQPMRVLRRRAGHDDKSDSVWQMDGAVDPQKIARSFSYCEVASLLDVLESQIGGPALKLVDKRRDVPIRQDNARYGRTWYLSLEELKLIWVTCDVRSAYRPGRQSDTNGWNAYWELAVERRCKRRTLSRGTGVNRRRKKFRTPVPQRWLSVVFAGVLQTICGRPDG